MIKKMNYLIDKKLKVGMTGILLLILFGTFMELIGVTVILPVVNLAIDVNYQENFWCQIVMNLTGYETREEIMLIMITATIAIYIIKSFYLSWMYSRLYQFSAVIKRQMAVKLMESYLRQPYAFFLKKNTSELIRGVNSDTAQFYEIVLNCLLVISNGLTAAALLLTLFMTNWMMTLMVIVLLALCAGVILIIVQKRTRYFGKRNQKLSGYLIKYLQQTFEGVKEIKILNSESYFIKRYKETYKEQTDISRKYSLMNLIPKYMIEMVCIVGVMVYLGINIIYNPEYMEIVPQLAVFVAAAYKLLPSVNALYAYMNTIIYHKASLDLIYHDVKEADGLNAGFMNTDDYSVVWKFDNKIELSHVSFRYEGTRENVLDDVNIEVPKGKSVAFIGASGGGKTTTADLVLGLLVPCSGEVLVDGKNIETNMGAWRKQIGYIPQSIYLLDGSIKSNVAFGLSDDEIDETSVWKALEEAQLKGFVEGLENGIQTEVGERGVRISGGQRQRIGIARALYHKPDILVFDEATSALDNETEKEVMHAIESLHGNKTMIMIAHRLSTIENCDIVYKIENGKVIRER